MDKTNSVYLEGPIAGCHYVKDRADGGLVAGFSFATAIPNPDATADMKPSERIRELMIHRVRVVASALEASSLRSLAESYRGKAALQPYEVNGGVLLEEGGEAVVECRMADLRKAGAIKITGNNEMSLSGSIDSVSYTDRFARIILDTGVSKVSTFFPKKTFPNAWEMIANGSLKKGSLISAKGPLMSMKVTDGKRELLTAVVVPHHMEQIRLREDKRKTSAPTL